MCILAKFVVAAFLLDINEETFRSKQQFKLGHLYTSCVRLQDIHFLVVGNKIVGSSVKLQTTFVSS